jgi:two-component system, cell cycle response regulator
MTPAPKDTALLKQCDPVPSRETVHEQAQAATLITVPELPPPALKRDACLVQIYPTGPGMGCRYNLAQSSVVVGRATECEICLEDLSVSRHHLRIQPGIDGYYVIDLQSTNGTFINDKPVSMCKLMDGDYLRVGIIIFRYLAGGNIETEYHEEIYRLTIIDPLADIYNKRYFLDYLDRELARSIRHRRPLSLALFDIDRFKEVNDRFGHLGGDHVLRELAEVVKKTVRREELFARYGGEEFALVWPETTRDKAVYISEQIRDLVAKHSFSYAGKSFPLSISLGVVTIEGGSNVSLTDLIRQADEKLYLAKQSGRNRVVG